ncbi:MAG: hypothetical protein V3V08_20145 [Nannocystaceae bacterium]
MKIRDHILLAMGTCAAGGAVESVWVAQGAEGAGWATRFLLSALVGAVAVGLAGAIFGVVQGVIAVPLLVAARRLGLSRRLAGFVAHDRAAAREPVVRVHAFCIALVPLIVLGLLSHRRAQVAFRGLHAVDLELDLVIVAGVGLVAVVVLGSAFLGRLLERPVRFMDRSFGLPFPRRNVSTCLRQFLNKWL